MRVAASTNRNQAPSDVGWTSFTDRDASLTVKVKFAENLKVKAVRLWPNHRLPYCSCHIAGKQFKTEKTSGTAKRPVWDESFGPIWISRSCNDVVFQIWADQGSSPHTVIGQAQVDLQAVRAQGEVYLQLPVQCLRANSHQGTLHVSLEYIEATQQPDGTSVQRRFSNKFGRAPRISRSPSFDADAVLLAQFRGERKRLVEEIQQLEQDLGDLRRLLYQFTSVDRPGQILTYEGASIQQEILYKQCRVSRLKYGDKELQAAEELIVEHTLVEPEIRDVFERYIFDGVTAELQKMEREGTGWADVSVAGKVRQAACSKLLELDEANALEKINIWVKLLDKLYSQLDKPLPLYRTVDFDLEYAANQDSARIAPPLAPSSVSFPNASDADSSPPSPLASDWYPQSLWSPVSSLHDTIGLNQAVVRDSMPSTLGASVTELTRTSPAPSHVDPATVTLEAPDTTTNLFAGSKDLTLEEAVNQLLDDIITYGSPVPALMYEGTAEVAAPDPFNTNHATTPDKQLCYTSSNGLPSGMHVPNSNPLLSSMASPASPPVQTLTHTQSEPLRSTWSSVNRHCLRPPLQSQAPGTNHSCPTTADTGSDVFSMHTPFGMSECFTDSTIHEGQCSALSVPTAAAAVCLDAATSYHPPPIHATVVDIQTPLSISSGMSTPHMQTWHGTPAPSVMNATSTTVVDKQTSGSIPSALTKAPTLSATGGTNAGTTIHTQTSFKTPSGITTTAGSGSVSSVSALRMKLTGRSCNQLVSSQVTPPTTSSEFLSTSHTDLMDSSGYEPRVLEQSLSTKQSDLASSISTEGKVKPLPAAAGTPAAVANIARPPTTFPSEDTAPDPTMPSKAISSATTLQAPTTASTALITAAPDPVMPSNTMSSATTPQAPTTASTEETTAAKARSSTEISSASTADKNSGPISGSGVPSSVAGAKKAQCWSELKRVKEVSELFREFQMEEKRAKKANRGKGPDLQTKKVPTVQLETPLQREVKEEIVKYEPLVARLAHEVDMLKAKHMDEVVDFVFKLDRELKSSGMRHVVEVLDHYATNPLEHYSGKPWPKMLHRALRRAAVLWKQVFEMVHTCREWTRNSKHAQEDMDAIVLYYNAMCNEVTCISKQTQEAKFPDLGIPWEDVCYQDLKLAFQNLLRIYIQCAVEDIQHLDSQQSDCPDTVSQGFKKLHEALKFLSKAMVFTGGLDSDTKQVFSTHIEGPAKQYIALHKQLQLTATAA